MKDQQKYIKSIVLLVTTIFIIGGWVEELIGKNVASFITSISTISLIIYGLYLAWDKWLWKQKWFSYLLCKLVGFYEYPILKGKWQINYISSYNNGTRGIGEAIIRQSYSSIFVEGSFRENSSFESFIAQLKQKENGKWFFVYAYRNKPYNTNLTSSVSGGMHEGFAYLDVVSKTKLEGYYSNDENRKTRGKIVFTKIKTR